MKEYVANMLQWVNARPQHKVLLSQMLVADLLHGALKDIKNRLYLERNLESNLFEFTSFLEKIVHSYTYQLP